MENINFPQLVSNCIQEYQERLSKSNVDSYQYTLYFKVFKDNSLMEVSSIWELLRGTKGCILIHCKSQLAVTNYYDWYYVQYIDEKGCVFDNCLDNNFKFYAYSLFSYRNQHLALCYKEIYKLYDIPISGSVIDWAKQVPNFWNLYNKVKDIESEKEIFLIAECYRKDEEILKLQREIDNYKTQLRLEQ